MYSQALLLSLCASGAVLAYANDWVDIHPHMHDIQINDFAYGGTACPPGGLQAMLSEGKNYLQVMFDQYTAHSIDDRHGYVRKTCQYRVALDVPQGLKVQLVDMTYRGQVSVHPKGVAGMNAFHLFAGQPVGAFMQEIWQHYPVHKAEYFSMHHEVEPQLRVSSFCGQNVSLQVNTSAFASHALAAQPTQLQFHKDAGHGAIYHLQWQRC